MKSPFRESRKDIVEVARLFPREGLQQRTAEEIALRRFTSRSRKLSKTEIALKIDQELANEAVMADVVETRGAAIAVLESPKSKAVAASGSERSKQTGKGQPAM